MKFLPNSFPLMK